MTTTGAPKRRLCGKVAPTGPAALKTVIYQIVDEWGTRFAALQAGDAAWVGVPIENQTAGGPVRRRSL